MRRAIAQLACVAASVLAPIFASGCATNEKVVRIVDGRAIPGAYVPPEAYASYLRAAISDAGGDLAGAIQGYHIASVLGPADPEPLTRLGDARCRRDPRDPQADDAFKKALALDGDYAPAWEARAACAERRGQTREAVESARRASEADPRAVAPLASLAELDTSDARQEDLRARLVGMTLIASTDAAGWEALATWARGHGDARLEARALARVVSLSPHRANVDAATLRIAGDGAIGAARALSRARVDSHGGAIDPRVARFAIDDALLAGDVDGARRLCTRAHLPLVVAAARALLLGDPRAARALAAPVADADPHAVDARMVLAAAALEMHDAPSLARALAVRAPSDAPVPPEAWLAYARALSRESGRDGGPDATRALLQAIAREPLVAGDPLATPIAVALAVRGAIDAVELDASGRIELAERRGEASPDDALSKADARHRLLALARRSPRDPLTLALARRLAPLRATDPIVAVALARLALAGAPGMSSMSGALTRFDPSDPLVAAASLDFALYAKDITAIPLARARLAAVARTPAERARIVQ